jgi:hypothetical protein
LFFSKAKQVPERKMPLSDTFNDPARHPAHRFEEKHGVSGIAGDYVFPRDMTAAAYEDYYTWEFSPHGGIARHPGVFRDHDAPESKLNNLKPGPVARYVAEKASPEYRALLAEGWRQLEAANPVLKKLDFDRSNGGEMYNALMGVTSGFNPDDINFYLKLQRDNVLPGLHIQTAPAFKVHMEWMENRMSVCDRPGWIPSLPTLEKIRSEFREKKPTMGERLSGLLPPRFQPK